jgi:hypothetical protein
VLQHPFKACKSLAVGTANPDQIINMSKKFRNYAHECAVLVKDATGVACSDEQVVESITQVNNAIAEGIKDAEQKIQNFSAENAIQIVKILDKQCEINIISDVTNLVEFREVEQTVNNLNKTTLYVKRGLTIATGFRENEKLIESANKMYNAFRKSTADIAQIAQNTGIKEGCIKQIKNHLFLEKTSVG